MSNKKILSNEKVKASVYRDREEIQLTLSYVGDVARDVCEILMGVLRENFVEDYLGREEQSRFDRNCADFERDVERKSGGGVEDNVLHIVINKPGVSRRALDISVGPINDKMSGDCSLLFYFDSEVTEDQFEELYDQLAETFERLVRNKFRK